jgi:uncharacterized membrane protein
MSTARRLERVIEVALTAGVFVSGLLLVAGLGFGSPRPLWAGVLLLIITPVVRVIVVTVGLVLDHDWLFAGVSLFVLAVLLSSAYVSGRVHSSAPRAGSSPRAALGI